MVYILSGLLTGGVLTAICWPLFRGDKSLESSVLEETEWDLLIRKKEVVLGNIQDLDFEHQCGKLSDEDYNKLRTELAGEAAGVIEAIDEIESAQDLDALIRRETSARKSRVSKSHICPQCGHGNPKKNQFCADCGGKLY